MGDDARRVIEGEALRRARHDLRAPLAIIGGFAEVLSGERPVSDEERREFARRIGAAAQQLRDALDELLGGP